MSNPTKQLPDPGSICPQMDGVTGIAGGGITVKPIDKPHTPSSSGTAERLKKRANELYALKRIGAENLPYTAPELIPQIESRSLLSALEAVAEELDQLRQELGSRRPG